MKKVSDSIKHINTSAKIGLATIAATGMLASNPQKADASLIIQNPTNYSASLDRELYGAALGNNSSAPNSVVIGSGSADFFFDQNLTQEHFQGNVGNVIDTATGLQPNRIYQLTEQGFMYERDLNAEGNVQNWNLGSGAIAIAKPQSINGNNILPYLISNDAGQTANVYGLNLTDNSVIDFNLILNNHSNLTKFTGLESYLDPKENLRLITVEQHNFAAQGIIKDFDLSGNMDQGFYTDIGRAFDATFDKENKRLFVSYDDGIAEFSYNAIPEPSTIFLIGLGALATLSRKLYKKK